MVWKKLKKLKKIKLNKNEKAEMRYNLSTLINRENISSVRISNSFRHKYQRSFLSFNLLTHKNMFVGILIAALLLTGGGTSLAAEAAIPGDVLYPIKLEVNEKVRTVLSFDEEKKADWSAKRAERRLEEANKLSEKGELDSEKSEFLAKKLKEHIDKTSHLVEKLEDKGNIQAAARINARLKIMLFANSDDIDEENHDNNTATSTEDVIDDEDDDHDEDNEDEDDEDDDKFFNWGKLKKEIRLQLVSSTVWEIKIKDKISSSTVRDEFKSHAAEGVKKATEHKLEEVQKYYEKKKDRITEEADARFQEKFSEAEQAKAEADQKMEEEEYAEAFTLYHKTSRLAEQAKRIVQKGKKKEDHDEDHDDEDEDEDEDHDNNTTTSTEDVIDDDADSSDLSAQADENPVEVEDDEDDDEDRDKDKDKDKDRDKDRGRGRDHDDDHDEDKD